MNELTDEETRLLGELAAELEERVTELERVIAEDDDDDDDEPAVAAGSTEVYDDATDPDRKASMTPTTPTTTTTSGLVAEALAPRPAPLPEPTGSNVVTKRDGIDGYGLYVEVITYWPATNKMHSHFRMLLAETSFSHSTRAAGTKQARWYCERFKDHDAARAAFEKKLATLFDPSRSLKAVLRDEPILIQLTAVDVDQLRAGEAPYCRYAGQHAIDKKRGKLDDATWTVPTTPVTGAAVPTL